MRTSISDFLRDGHLDIDGLLAFHRNAFGTAAMLHDPIADQVRTNRETWREQRDNLGDQMQSMLDGAESRGDERLTASEQRRYNDLKRSHSELGAKIDEASERIEELLTGAQRRTDANEVRRSIGGWQVGSEPNPVYRRDDPLGPSYFRDLALTSQPGSQHAPEVVEARSRLVASQETRAGDMSTGAGAGGELAPPLWLAEDFVALARPGRVTADLCQRMTLPSGVSSINLPKVATGATVAVQATQNSTISDTAMTTTSVSSGITTLAGKQIVSLQLVQQSGVPIDRVILQDLAMAYAVSLDQQVLYGANSSGEVAGLVGIANNTAFTTTQPAPASVTQVNSLYYTVSKAASAMHTTLYRAPDAIVMHPRRWDWIIGSVDSSARPLVVPAGPQFNGLGAGTGGPVPAEGASGMFGSYPVYLDPNISTTANSATNQDEIYLVRRDQLWLWETPVQPMSFDATYADQLSILYRVHGFMALIANRYAAAVQSVRGTGLVAP